jgi:hypothetical protein
LEFESAYSMAFAYCSELPAQPPPQLAMNFTPGNGSTLHLVDLGESRIGTLFSPAAF